MHVHKLNSVSEKQIDKSNIFIELHSAHWRAPYKISLQELISARPDEDINIVQYNISNNIDHSTLIIDPSTLKVKVNTKMVSNVFSEKFIDQNISYNSPPNNVSTVRGMTLLTDGNYLYVWIESEKRWKRSLLSEW